MQVDLLIARFPFKGAEHPDTTDWLLKTQAKTLRDKRIGKVVMSKFDDTPITMTRNACLNLAKYHQVDYILMIDSDMSPDLPLEGAKPFWDTSLDFALQHRHRPCVIGAPYCGPPPFSNVFVFYWANWMNDCANPDYKLEQYTRKGVEHKTGILEVAALPTGLVLIDARALEFINPPYFYYEWSDATESQKASTEDVVFTRDLSIAGVPQYCNWDAWAGHHKAYMASKPKAPEVAQLRKRFSAQVVADLMTMQGKMEDNGHSEVEVVKERHEPNPDDAPREAREARVDGGSATHTPQQEPSCNNLVPPPLAFSSEGEQA